MDIFTKFKSTIKISPVHRDNEVFQLHYKLTFALLAASGVMIASKQHFGDPIDCISKDDVPEKLLETYCWIQGTFTLPTACNLTYEQGAAHPCIDTFITSGSNTNHEPENTRRYHAYYQWVYFMLFFQAMGFYAPHLIWKSVESKLLVELSDNLKEAISKDQEKREKHVEKLITYFVRRRNIAYFHDRIYRYFTACEVMNLLNILVQLFCVDWFLSWNFSKYGWDSLIRALDYRIEPDTDPMELVFPKMTKCTFHRFGPSGDIVKYDALCILPLNILNEKIYVIMWFWFYILGLITSVWLVYRFATYKSSRLRLRIITRRVGLIESNHLQHSLSRVSCGDWFILSMICKNMDINLFADFIRNLSLAIDKDEYHYMKRDNKVEGVPKRDLTLIDMNS